MKQDEEKKRDCHRDFHQTEKGLTAPRSGDIARDRKKGGLNFLYGVTWITRIL